MKLEKQCYLLTFRADIEKRTIFWSFYLTPFFVFHHSFFWNLSSLGSRISVSFSSHVYLNSHLLTIASSSSSAHPLILVFLRWFFISLFCYPFCWYYLLIWLFICLLPVCWWLRNLSPERIFFWDRSICVRTSWCLINTLNVKVYKSELIPQFFPTLTTLPAPQKKENCS